MQDFPVNREILKIIFSYEVRLLKDIKMNYI